MQFRTVLEEQLKTQLGVPTVLLAVQGGGSTLEQVTHALQHDYPVLVFKESGGCAKMIADFFEPLKRSFETDEVPSHAMLCLLCYAMLCDAMR